MNSKCQITDAFWTEPGQGCFLMKQNWDHFDLPLLSFDNKALKMVNLRPMDLQYLGRFTAYYELEDHIYFCLNPKDFPHLDFEKTAIFVAGSFNKWGTTDNKDDWQIRAPSTDNDQSTHLWSCRVHKDHVFKRGKIAFKFITDANVWINPPHSAPNFTQDKAGNCNYALNINQSGKHAFQFDVIGGRGMDSKTQLISKTANGSESILLIPGMSFFELASKRPLGAFPEKRHTLFRLFAPRATAVRVEIFTEPNKPEFGKSIDLALNSDQLTWEGKFPQNLNGCFYYYHVDGVNDGQTTCFDPKMQILDPYALATAGASGPGIIIERDSLPQGQAEETRYETPAWQNLIILEGHIRDLTSYAPIDIPEIERRGFTGLSKWIRTENSYFKKLGVNTLELQPIQQFDSKTVDEYHWGYMTTNYFSPCCHYAQIPEKGSQINEFYQLVKTCHNNGLAVIIDVVYNHVGEPPFLKYIDKQYYLHTDKKGELINWSGCGNTVRAHTPMAKRLITDSLIHLVKTYNVDGFRFDLAELLGIDVLKEIENKVKAVKPDIILVAEPWSFRGSMIDSLKYAGFAFWNDGFREFIASYVTGVGDAAGLYYYMKGSLDHHSCWPCQSVNYVESHDDRCWIDKITENHDHNGHDPSKRDIYRSHMMFAILMCSIGIPLLSAGQDFLRSKGGKNNTYQRAGLNVLDYQRIHEYSLSHHYCQQWIAFRNSHWGDLLKLRKHPSQSYIRLYPVEKKPAAALLFNADFSHGSRQILIAFNPSDKNAEIPIFDMPADNWKELADHHSFNFDGILNERLNFHNWKLHLEPNSLGLWVRET